MQQTQAAAVPVATVSGKQLAALGLSAGSTVLVRQGQAEIRVAIDADDALPDGVVRLATAHPTTVALGGMFDPIEIKQG